MNRRGPRDSCRPLTPQGALVGALLFGFAALAQPGFSQAFVPPRGEGNVTITYEDILARGHLLDNGKRASGANANDPVRVNTLRAEVEFGLTERVALKVAVPFVAARYGGGAPHLIGVSGQSTTIDDGTYHGSFQDFRFGARMNVASRPLFITPFVEGVVPSHHYESRGHGTIGLDLRALIIGANVAGFVDIIPGTYFHAQVSHAIVQEVAGIRPNGSRVDSEVGYFVTPRLALRFLDSFQITHDGIAFQQPGQSRDVSLNHDRLHRYNFLNLGGGLAFALNESLDVFGTASKMVWGENVHPHWGVSAGANWNFRAGGGRVAPSRARAIAPSTDVRLPTSAISAMLRPRT